MTNPPTNPPRGSQPSKLRAKVIPLGTSVTTDAHQEITETYSQESQEPNPSLAEIEKFKEDKDPKVWVTEAAEQPVGAVPSTDPPSEEPKTPKSGKTKVIDPELRHIAEFMSPQYVEGILKYLFSEHPVLPSFLLWNIADSDHGFAIRVDRLIHSPTYIRTIQPALFQIFPDGFHHCHQAIAGAMVNFAILDVLKKG